MITDRLFAVDKLLTRQMEKEIVADVKFRDVPDLYSEFAIFESARILAEQIKIPSELLTFLHSKSRWHPMRIDEWSLGVRSACAIDLMLRRVFKQRLGQFGELIDGGETLRNLRQGTLLITFHGAFVRLARPLFADSIPSGVQLDRRSTKDDPRGALFNAMRTLQEGSSVLMAPDGLQGNTSATVRVFGIETMVGEGTAFLAFSSGCETAWYTVLRQDDRFKVHIEPAPKRNDGEAFASFRERFLHFYASKIEENFAGDSQNIALLPRWRRPFANHISM